MTKVIDEAVLFIRYNMIQSRFLASPTDAILMQEIKDQLTATMQAFDPAPTKRPPAHVHGATSESHNNLPESGVASNGISDPPSIDTSDGACKACRVQ